MSSCIECRKRSRAWSRISIQNYFRLQLRIKKKRTTIWRKLCLCLIYPVQQVGKSNAWTGRTHVSRESTQEKLSFFSEKFLSGKTGFFCRANVQPTEKEMETNFSPDSSIFLWPKFQQDDTNYLWPIVHGGAVRNFLRPTPRDVLKTESFLHGRTTETPQMNLVNK